MLRSTLHLALLASILGVPSAAPMPEPTADATARSEWSDWRSAWALAAHFDVRLLRDGLREPVALTSLPATGLLAVVQRRGPVTLVGPDGTRTIAVDGGDPGPGRSSNGACAAGDGRTVFVTWTGRVPGGRPRSGVTRLRVAAEGPVGVAARDLPGAPPPGEALTCRVTDRHLRVLSREDGASVALDLPAALGEPFALEPAPDGPADRERDRGFPLDGGSWAQVDDAGGVRFAPREGPTVPLGVLPEGLDAVGIVRFGPRDRAVPAVGRNRLHVATAARPGGPRPGIRTLRLGPRPRPGTRAEPFVEHSGGTPRPIVALARTPRGLAVLADAPPGEPGGRLFEITYRPSTEYPYRLGEEPRVGSAADAEAHAVMTRRGCFACHSLHARRLVGPSLDPARLPQRLAERLASAEYRRRSRALDRSADPAVRRWRSARRQVLAAGGLDRLKAWMRYHLMDPAFDLPEARMPEMRLDEDEIASVTEYLLDGTRARAARRRPRSSPPPKPLR